MSKNEQCKYFIPYETDLNGAQLMGFSNKDHVVMKIGSRIAKGVYIPATEEQYYAYMKDVWAEEKRIERERKCKVISEKTGKLIRCTKSCRECKMSRTGGILSLDRLIETGFDRASSDDVEESAINRVLLGHVANELKTEDPTLWTILSMVAEDMTRNEVSKATGSPKSTVNDRMKKAQKIARTILGEAPPPPIKPFE